MVISFLYQDILNISMTYISRESLAPQLHVNSMVGAYGVRNNVLFHEGTMFAIGRV